MSWLPIQLMARTRDLAWVRSADADALRVRQSPTEGDPPSGLDSLCFANIMPVSVIFDAAKSWALATISSIGNVRWHVLSRCVQQTHERLPETIPVREVHLLIRQPGFRPTEIILVTTLLDPKRYPKAELAQLYQLCWLATARQFQTPQNYVQDGDDSRA